MLLMYCYRSISFQLRRFFRRSRGRLRSIKFYYFFFLPLEALLFFARAFFLAAFLGGAFLAALFFGAAAFATGAAACSSLPVASGACGAGAAFFFGSSGAVNRWPSNAISVIRTAV